MECKLFQEIPCIKYHVKALASSFPYLALSDGADGVLFDLSASCADIQEIRMHGHHREISTLRIGQSPEDGKILITAANDYLIVWNIRAVIAAQTNGDLVRGRVLYPCQELPLYVALSHDSLLTCVVAEHSFLVIDTLNKKVVMQMDISGLSAAEFVGDDKVVTTLSDGTIMLVNIETQEVIWEKHCGGGLASLLCCKFNKKFSIGSRTTTVQEFLFDHRDGKYKEYMKIDLEEAQMRADQQWTSKVDGDISRDHVIALMYHNHAPDDYMNILGDSCRLICATERALFVINCQNHDVTMCRYLDYDVTGPPVISQACFTTDDTGKILCAVVMTLERRVLVLSIEIPEVTRAPVISFISSSPLQPSSVLHSTSKISKPSKPKEDKPLTFRSKVKSSGYAAAPRMTMFKPNLSKPGKPHTSVKPKKSTPTPHLNHSSNPDWLNSVGVSRSFAFCEIDTTVNFIAVSDRSSFAACCLNDLTIHVTEMSSLTSANPKSKVIIEHTKSADGCHWAHGKDILLTYSRSREIKLWSPPFTNESILSFHPESPGKIPKDLSHVQFYYLDQFILAALGNSLCLYKYALHEGPKDDVKRYLSQSKHKLIGQWPMTNAQHITCVTAPNGIYSYVALTAGSNRSVAAFDLSTEQQVHNFEDLHTRPVHTILHALGSSNSASGLSDVFVTSAVSDGIKLWDLRTQRCMRKFNLHQNKLKCDVTLSQCGKFIATATDGKAVCIYDVRKAFPLHELSVKSRATALSFASDSTRILVGNGLSRLEVVSPY